MIVRKEAEPFLPFQAPARDEGIAPRKGGDCDNGCGGLATVRIAAGPFRYCSHACRAKDGVGPSYWAAEYLRLRAESDAAIDAATAAANPRDIGWLEAAERRFDCTPRQRRLARILVAA